MSDANEDVSDGSHYDEGEGLLDEEEIDLSQVDRLQGQIDTIEAIENPIEKEAAVKQWTEDLNG